MMPYYNFVTGNYDPPSPPANDEQARQYIPQHPSAQGLYDVYRAQGLSILDAMKNVWSACLGEHTGSLPGGEEPNDRFPPVRGAWTPFDMDDA